MAASIPAYLAEAPSLGTTLTRMFEVYGAERHLGTWDAAREGYVWTTYAETYAVVRRLVAGLRAAGVPRRSEVGILLGNRKEWLMVDFAAAVHDCVVVGLHPAWPEEKLRAVLKEAGVKVVFTDTAEGRAAVLGLMRDTDVVQVVDVSDADAGGAAEALDPPQSVIRYADLLAAGERAIAGEDDGEAAVDAEIAAVGTPDVEGGEDNEVFTIMYSSGTSGVPKGIATPKATWRATNCNPGPLASISNASERRTVSYLSLAHGADRGVCWFTSMAGGSTGFVTFPELSPGYYKQLRALQPTFFLAMSCTWQDLYNGYYRRVTPKVDEALRSRLRFAPVSEASDFGVGNRTASFLSDDSFLSAGAAAVTPLLDAGGEAVWQEFARSATYAALTKAFCATREGRAVTEQCVEHIRENLGNSLLIAVTGGAATAPAVLDFMARCLSDGNECRAINSYGSTEFPGISSNGEVSGDVELRLEAVTLPNGDVRYSPPESGEIVVRRRDGKCTTYWQRPDLTAKNWDGEGWYRTGDIGRLDADGKLTIIDRVLNVEEMYWKGDSVWIEPGRLEGLFAGATPTVSSCVVVADRNREGYVVIARVAASKRVRKAPPTSASLLATFTRAADEHGLKDYERPMGVVVAEERWTENNGLLTISGKPNRGAVKARYADDVGLHYHDAEELAEWLAENAASHSPSASPSPPSGVEDDSTSRESAADSADALADDGVASALRRRAAVLLAALEEEHRSDEHSLAQRHLAETTGCALPDVRKGSRRVGLWTTAPSGEKHWVDTARGKDWLVGPEQLSFHDVAELHPDPIPPAPDAVTDAVLRCEVVRDGAAAGTLDVPVSSMEGPRARARRVAAALQVPLHSVRLSNEVGSVPPIGAALPVPAAAPLRFAATAEVVVPAGRGLYPLAQGPAAELNEQFAKVKRRALAIRDAYSGWLEEHATRRAAAQEELENTIEAMDRAVFHGHRKAVVDALTRFCDEGAGTPATTETSAPDECATPAAAVAFVTDRLGLADLGTAIATLRRVLCGKRDVLRSRVKLSCTGQSGEAVAAWAALDDELVRLRLLGDHLDVDTRALPVTWRMNVDWIIPPQTRETCQCMFGCGRFVYTEQLEAHSNGFAGPCNPEVGVADDAGSTPVGGDQSVECCVSGAMIDEELFETVVPEGGRLPYRAPRLRSLDSGVCRRPEYHALLRALWGVWAATDPADPRREALHRLLRLADRHPADGDVWVPDKQHPFWLHKYVCVGKDVGHFDTPASLFARACEAFPQRLAFGISTAVPDRPRRSHVLSLPRAAGVDVVQHRGFSWVRYAGLWSMVAPVAAKLRAALPPGSGVLIGGYNELEWVVADFACALAGMVSVGLHTTLDLAGAGVVARGVEAAALLTMADLCARGGGAWTAAALAKEVPSLRLVVCMDGGASTVGETAAETASFFDWVADGKASAAFHPSSEALFKVRGRSWGGKDVTTVLATSGSSGRPKLVAVDVDSFVADISGDIEERATVSESLTISYIPLSHSSDRYKVWQHAVLGGRVALCFYPAHHWSAHETEKKDRMLEYSSPVAALFAQIRAAAPTSMSCPPNVWAGLMDVYEARRAQGNNGTALGLKTYAHETFGPRIKYLATGGSPTPSHVLKFAEALCREVNASFVDSYGATECGAIMANGRLEGSKFANTKVLLLRRPDLSGVCDNPSCRVGEVAVQTPSMAVGYLNDAEASAAAFVTVGADGRLAHPQFPDLTQPRAAPGRWYVTGDIAAWDRTGRRYHLLDRAGSLVATKGGALVAPAQVEAKLEALPGVAHAFVFATPQCTAVGAVLARRGGPPEAPEAALEDGGAYDALLGAPERAAWRAEELAPLLQGAPLVLRAARGAWTVPGGFLSGELKKRRGVLMARYAPALERALQAADAQ